MGFLRRGRVSKLRPFDEKTAYSRLHGYRDEDVKIVKVEPKRPRYAPKVSGDDLRAAFEKKLDSREPEEEVAVKPPKTKAKRTRRKAAPAAAEPEPIDPSANGETPT